MIVANSGTVGVLALMAVTCGGAKTRVCSDCKITIGTMSVGARKLCVADF